METPTIRCTTDNHIRALTFQGEKRRRRCSDAKLHVHRDYKNREKKKRNNLLAKWMSDVQTCNPSATRSVGVWEPRRRNEQEPTHSNTASRRREPRLTLLENLRYTSTNKQPSQLTPTNTGPALELRSESLHEPFSENARDLATTKPLFLCTSTLERPNWRHLITLEVA
jgi:hypothetical protein